MNKLEIKAELEQLENKFFFKLVKMYPIPGWGYPKLAKAETRTFERFNSSLLYNINEGNNLNG